MNYYTYAMMSADSRRAIRESYRRRFPITSAAERLLSYCFKSRSIVPVIGLMPLSAFYV